MSSVFRVRVPFVTMVNSDDENDEGFRKHEAALVAAESNKTKKTPDEHKDPTEQPKARTDYKKRAAAFEAERDELQKKLDDLNRESDHSPKRARVDETANLVATAIGSALEKLTEKLAPKEAPPP